MNDQAHVSPTTYFLHMSLFIPFDLILIHKIERESVKLTEEKKVIVYPLQLHGVI